MNVNMALNCPTNLSFSLIFVGMMRSYYGLLLLFVALLSGCGGCNVGEPYDGDENPLWEQHKVYGRVKTLKTEYFSPMIKDGKTVPGSSVGDNITMDSINAKGQLLVSKVFTLDGQLKNYDVFTYNPEGEIIAIETYTGTGMLSSHQEIYFNTDGKKLKQVVTLATDDGEKSYWRSWVYDSVGHLVESYVFGVDSTIASRETLTYYEGDSGKLHVHSLYVGRDTLKYINEYVYNTKGQDSILYRHRPNATGDSVTYQSKYEYTYDDKGNELTRNLLNPEGVVRAKSRYEYIFDDHGNWTQRIDIVDEETNVVKVRTFTYYE